MLTALHGAYYPNNFGDVLILSIQAQWIKEITGGTVALPFATPSYDATIKPERIKGFKALNKSRKLIYGAGGYLGEPPNVSFSWNARFFRNHVLSAEYFNAKSKPYALIGVGVGPLSNAFVRHEVLRICRKAKVVAVRDEESKNHLENYGHDVSQIKVTADVALSLTKDCLSFSSLERAKMLVPESSKKYIALHIGVDMFSPNNKENSMMLINEVVEFFKIHHELILPVVIIDNDHYTLRSMLDFIKSKLGDNLIIYKHSIANDTAAFLSQLDFVITTKLHVGIVAYSLGVDCAGIPTHSKTQRFYNQINQPDLCITMDNLKKNKIRTLLENILNIGWRNNLRRVRESTQPKLKKLALENKKIITDFLLSNDLDV